MTTTTMHFGPEWMRKAPSRANPSPPLATPTATGASTYSALVAPASQPHPEKSDLANPFRYSKEDMIRIYKEGGGKGGLGLEVERWEGIVREVGSDPVSLKEMSDAEKKIFSGPLNSEMRRRPSVDYLSLSTTGLGERPKLSHANSSANSPMRERLGGFMGRRRDSTDQPPLSLPRKLSQSSLQPPLVSPRDALPSPRARIGTGFDGVLSDSWSSRRRASEGIGKGIGRAGDAGDPQDGSKTEGIKEEEEELGDLRTDAREGNGIHPSSDPTASPVGVNGANNGQPLSDTLPGRMGNLSMDSRTQGANGSSPALPSTADNMPSGPPPGLVDPASIEWTYLDPQGQIQGPFKGEIMQKWYDDGYFNPTLLMKRPQVDAEWTSVGDLLQRAGSTRIFLTPLMPAAPPGLPRRDPLLDGPIQDGSFGSPFQPVPTRSLRTGALDTYLHNGSVVPDSPSSQFSAGRFSNDSPDPSVFGGRLAGHMFNGSPVGPRLGFIQGNGLEPQRRATFDNIVDPLLSRQGFSSFAHSRGSVDGLGFTGSMDSGPNHAYIASNASQASLGDKSDEFSNTRFSNNTLSGGQSAFASNDFNSSPFLGVREGPRLIKRELYERSESQSSIANQFTNGSIGYSSPVQSFGPGQSLAYPAQHQPDNRTLQSVQSTPERQPAAALAQSSFVSSPMHSPWPTQDTVAPRRPFDPDYPTSRNTVPVPQKTPVQPVQPVTSQVRNISTSTNQSAWFANTAGEGWGPDTTSLTAANLGQHNKQQELQSQEEKDKPPGNEISESPVSPPDEIVRQPVPAPVPDTIPVVPSAPVPEVATTTSKRRKANSQAVAAPATQVPAKPAAAAEVASLKPPSPVVTPAEAKSPWSIEEDKKPLSLREIQELELKKAEGRKAAERERNARAALAAPSTPSSADDIQTLSWGLPTSQAGTRQAKETSTSTAPAATPAGTAPSNPPVWTTATKTPVVKKTMKEIQEEEEKRKRVAAKDKETVAAAARRAYSDTTTRAAAPAQTGSAWTMVGAAGKTNSTIASRPATSTTPSKPAASTTLSTSLSAASVVSRPPAVTTPVRSPVVTAAMKLSPATTKVEDTPAPPSHEFLKWMTDSLKGLNASVNLEEIASMLLTFPLDPDPSTAEIISDLIYANSTTLDGRRFAAEFVSKRKADAKGILPGGASGKPLSIADVVKTQPKPAQNEWGGFKVVNKKKKGTRS